MTKCNAGEVAVKTSTGYLIWAAANLSGVGTFASNYYDFGALFHWGWKTAIQGNPSGGTINSVNVSNSTVQSASSWPTAQNPCPTDWRVPTDAEITDLISGSYTTSTYTTGTGQNTGLCITPRAIGGVPANQNLYFPNAGRRGQPAAGTGASQTDWNTYVNAGWGLYWSFNQNSSNSIAGNHLVFDSGRYTGSLGGSPKTYACSVRCVRDNK